jgi:hypothetical protein
MNDRMISDRTADIPDVGSRWIYKDHDMVYTVRIIANLEFKLPYHPITVVYQGANGNWWARSLITWRPAMKEQK